MAGAGYSSTPLFKKLGITPGLAVATIAEPEEFRGLLEPLPDDVRFLDTLADADVVMMFCLRRGVLEEHIDAAGKAIFPGGAIWVAWPKKASKIPTDMTGNAVRDVVLPRGLVDVKVTAISEVWSGLRIVWRKELRS